MSMVLDARPQAGQNFTLRPLSPALAAEVIGLDLRQPLDAATRDAVYAAFVRYHVLCFRDQALNKDQQIAFTQQFGTLERHIASNRGADNPFVHTVSNLDAAGRAQRKGRIASLAQRQIVPSGAVTRHRAACGDAATGGRQHLLRGHDGGV